MRRQSWRRGACVGLRQKRCIDRFRERSFSRNGLDDSERFQFGIGFCGIAIQVQLPGKEADWRKGIVRLGVLRKRRKNNNLVDQLPVKRRRRVKVSEIAYCHMTVLLRCALSSSSEALPGYCFVSRLRETGSFQHSISGFCAHKGVAKSPSPPPPERSQHDSRIKPKFSSSFGANIALRPCRSRNRTSRRKTESIWPLSPIPARDATQLPVNRPRTTISVNAVPRTPIPKISSAPQQISNHGNIAAIEFSRMGVWTKSY